LLTVFREALLDIANNLLNQRPMVSLQVPRMFPMAPICVTADHTLGGPTSSVGCLQGAKSGHEHANEHL
jgi:hypothetical protein